MNFLSFQYFVAVANADSIKDAANTLMIAPQSLSEHMRKLEQELGVELFTHTRPARLSACGERFLRYAESMLNERYQLEKELREMADRHREIVISISASDYPPFLTELFADFMVRFPGCLLTIVERPSQLSSATLKSYDLNISSNSLGRDMEEILIQGSDYKSKSRDALSANHLAVLVHRKLLRRIWGDQLQPNLDRLAQHAALSIFHDIPFIRLIYPGNDIWADELFQEHGFLPTIIAKSESADLCLSLCAAGAGAMVVPDGWALRKLGNAVRDGELLLLRMKEMHPLMQTIISYQRDKSLTEEERALIQMMREYAARV